MVILFSGNRIYKKNNTLRDVKIKNGFGSMERLVEIKEGNIL
jgi:hypothetical protein